MLAFMQEHGPLVIDDDSSVIKVNPHPWNKNASVIYLESPAGVGFSPWNVTQKEMVYNDMIASEDAFAALKEFYVLFDAFKPNPLFISGESYGGIYTPYLAW